MSGIKEAIILALPEKEDVKRALQDLIRGRAGLLTYLSLIGLILGLISVVRILVLGHGETVNTNAQIPWGMQIMTYIYLVLITTGCTFTNLVCTIFRPEEYRPVAPKIMFFGILTAIGGMFGLATELGHTERLYMWFLSPQPKSPMWWMAVWYTAYLALLIYSFIELRRGHLSVSHAWIDFIISLITNFTLGSLLGVVEQRFFYYSALLPLYIPLLGFITGVSAVILIIANEMKYLGDKGPSLLDFMRKILMIVVALGLLFGVSRLIIGLYGQIHGAEIFELYLSSQIIYVIILGSIVPLVLLYNFRSPFALSLISLYIMAIQLKMRYDLVVGGFIVPVWKAYTIPDYIKYTPSVDEILIFVGGLSLALFVYLLANSANWLKVRGEH